MLTLLTLVLATAQASDDAYATCCAEAGAYSCPEQVTVVGPGTQVSGSDASGLWKLTCSDGASFFPHAERRGVDTRPGAVLESFDAASVACFQAACPLPADVCIELDSTGTARVQDCRTSSVPDTKAFASAPRQRTAVIASPGRVVGAERLSLNSAVARATGALDAPTDAVVQVRRTSPATSVARATPAWTPEPAAVPPTPPTPAATPSWDTSAPAASPAPAPPAAPGYVNVPSRTAQLLRAEGAAAASANPVDWSIPDAPPTPCVPNPALRAPSTSQVDLGDEAVVAGRLDAAAGHYRAALGVDPCNGYAWAAIGGLLIDAGYASRARQSLAHATRLTPRNVLAWVRLAEAEMMLGDRGAAIEAYHQAIDLRPGYLPAEEGLRRVVRGQ